MLALISPAKKQDFTPAASGTAHSQPVFLAETAVLAALMRDCDAADLMHLMKISPKLADLNVGRFQAFSPSHTLENSKQAALAFRGDTYVGLQADSLTTADWGFADGHLAIISGLYGLLRPLDLIQPHRLEMGTRLVNPRGGNLYGFWNGHIADRIAEILAGRRDNWVINLASNEYFKAVQVDRLSGQLLTPVFKERRAGRLQVIGIKAKRARGQMARFIIRNRLTQPEALKEFEQDGYRFRPDLSDDAQWVFVA